jgi:hypothetical protein
VVIGGVLPQVLLTGRAYEGLAADLYLERTGKHTECELLDSMNEWQTSVHIAAYLSLDVHGQGVALELAALLGLLGLQHKGALLRRIGIGLFLAPDHLPVSSRG